MATWDRADLTGRVRQGIRDDAATDADRFVQDADVHLWLHDAQVDLAWRCRLLPSVSAATTFADATGTIALPADFLELNYLRVGTDDVQFTNDEVWFSWKDSLAEPDPPLGRIKDKIYVYPAPASGTAYELCHFKSPAEMANDAAFPEVPIPFRPKLVLYAKAMALMQLGQYDASDRHMALYETDLPPRSTMSRFRPGPTSLIRASGPFDADPGARHLGAE